MVNELLNEPDISQNIAFYRRASEIQIAFYQELERFDIAEKKWLSLIEEYQENGDKRGLGQSLNNLSLIYRSQERWDEAKTYIQEAAQNWEALEQYPEASESKYNEALIWQDLGEWTQTENALKQAISLSIKFDNSSERAQTNFLDAQNLLAEVYFQQGKLDSAYMLKKQIEFYLLQQQAKKSGLLRDLDQYFFQEEKDRLAAEAKLFRQTMISYAITGALVLLLVISLLALFGI